MQLDKDLTKREIDVVNLICKGMSNKEIAFKLSITERTVRQYITPIFRKMNVTSRAKLIVKCIPYIYKKDIKNV